MIPNLIIYGFTIIMLMVILHSLLVRVATNPNSNEYYLSFEAAKAAGIALAHQAGFIVAETDEEAEKMMLLV